MEREVRFVTKDPQAPRRKPEPRPDVAASGLALQRSAGNAAVARVAGPVLQRAWVDGEDTRYTTWSQPVDGLLWTFDRSTDKMAFEVVDEAGKEHAELQGEWKSHAEWLQMGWGLLPEAKKKTVAKEPEFDDLVSTGKRRFATAKPTGLDKRTRAARDQFFDEYYTTKDDFKQTIGGRKKDPEDVDPSSIQVSSLYKHGPGSSVRDRGDYQNTVEGYGATFNAAHNYGFPQGELYYDPAGKETTGPEKWGAPGNKVQKMSNSEIIFQQWRRAAQLIGGSGLEVQPLGKLVRGHVAGDGVPMLNVILGRTGGKVSRGGRTFSKGSDEFYAMLALPNCIAAVWLVADHGAELGIKGIASIKLLFGNSVEIDFEPLG